MEQFKLTVALNRGIDRSDEMAWGFTLPLLHPFYSHPPPPFFSITAQTSSQLQNSICMLMRKKEPSWSHPLSSSSFSCPFLHSCLPAPDQYIYIESVVDESGLVKNMNRSVCMRDLATTITLCCPIQFSCDPADPRAQRFRPCHSPRRSRLWWHPPVYLLQGKMGNTCRIGRDVREGSAKHKMLYAGSKPGMFESGPLWPVRPEFLLFSPCTAKSSQTDI